MIKRKIIKPTLETLNSLKKNIQIAASKNNKNENRTAPTGVLTAKTSNPVDNNNINTIK